MSRQGSVGNPAAVPLHPQAAEVADNRFMTEIRLCWDPAIDPAREAECAGPWLPQNEETIEALEALVVDGADGYGDGTHWIERR